MWHQSKPAGTARQHVQGDPPGSTQAGLPGGEDPPRAVRPLRRVFDRCDILARVAGGEPELRMVEGSFWYLTNRHETLGPNWKSM